MSIQWGLDIGTNSIGWAIIEQTDGMGGRIIDCGVRIFSEGVNDMNSDKEQSKNATRRLFRQTRRRLERRRHRKAKLLATLRNSGLAPMSNDELPEFFSLDPYICRSRGLMEQLTPYELGRALYHINQRRGFKSNRKAQKENDEEQGIVKTNIAALKSSIETSNSPTLGTYFASLKDHEKIRNRYTDRAMYLDEFTQIWEAQRQYYSQILTDDLFAALGEKTIFFQVPFSRRSNSKSALKNSVGFCTFEHGKRRAAKSSLLFQKFRIWQSVNNLRVIGGDRVDEDSQYLQNDEAERVIHYLMNNPSLQLDEPKGVKILVEILQLPKLPKFEKYQFNLTTLSGNSTRRKLNKAIGDLHRFSNEQLEDMVHTLQFAEDEEKTVKFAQNRWGFTAEEAQKFTDITLEDGYGSLSTRAMKRILPFLQQGMQYHEACLSAGYHHSKENIAEVTGEIPRIAPNDIRNPIVIVALNQLRLVGNELYQRFGQPDAIRVEMGRELRIPKSIRARLEKENRMREKRHKEIEEILQKEIGVTASRHDVIRYKLWEEAGCVCPYTGEEISLKRLFFQDVDVEHILPFSRTLDDSQINKTICVRSANLHKLDSTPYEKYHGTLQFDQILERVKSSKMPRNKKVRFTMTPETFAIRNADFIARQMNDTRHIAVQSRRLLYHLCPDVSIANGSITATLRHQWGLNAILSDSNKKERTDHRHHAIDALCIAFTSRSLLQKMSTSHALQIWKYVDRRPKIEEPWPSFRTDAHKAIQQIIVSHKMNKRARGQFHEATYYGRLMNYDGVHQRTGESGKGLYLKRERLDAIKDTVKIYKIVDPAVRAVVMQRLVDCGISADLLEEEAKVPIPKNAFAAPLYMTTKNGKQGPQIESARLAIAAGNMVPLYDGRTWVEPGSNHHYAIYEDDKGKRYGRIITLFEAYKRIQYNEPVINRTAPDGHRFVCAMQQNDMWILDAHPDELNLEDNELRPEISMKLFRIQKLTDGKISLIKPTHTRTSDNGRDLGFTKSPTTLKGFKVSVSPTGIVRWITE